jgi:hypothetical protein
VASSGHTLLKGHPTTRAHQQLHLVGVFCVGQHRLPLLLKKAALFDQDSMQKGVLYQSMISVSMRLLCIIKGREANTPKKIAVGHYCTHP